jgi:RND family efflux transporter MFP subunit
MKSARRRWLEGLAAAALAVLPIWWLSGGCEERIGPEAAAPTAPGAPPPGRTATVRSLRGPLVERVSGTVASARHTTVSSEIMARIVEVRPRAGSNVEQGDVLVVLDARDLDARAREAEEARRAARAERDLARKEAERVEGLHQRNVASQQDLDRARSRSQVAAAALEAAEQRLADAEVARTHAEIRSPVAGRVIDRLAEPGDTAAPSVPLLRIYDPATLRIEAPVRESLAVGLRTGQPIRVEIDALRRRFEGVIDEIVPFAEPGARTLLVKVRLPQDPALLAGMFGRIEVPAGEASRLLLPPAAVERVGQLEFVTVLRADGGAERRLVTTGRADGAGELEVLSGLVEGERVLLPARAAAASGS